VRPLIALALVGVWTVQIPPTLAQVNQGYGFRNPYAEYGTPYATYGEAYRNYGAAFPNFDAAYTNYGTAYGSHGVRSGAVTANAGAQQPYARQDYGNGYRYSAYRAENGDYRNDDNEDSRSQPSAVRGRSHGRHGYTRGYYRPSPYR
jgi:hypothetical protein